MTTHRGEMMGTDGKRQGSDRLPEDYAFAVMMNGLGKQMFVPIPKGQTLADVGAYWGYDIVGVMAKPSNYMGAMVKAVETVSTYKFKDGA